MLGIDDDDIRTEEFAGYGVNSPARVLHIWTMLLLENRARHP
jgi:hypothetical protein